MIKTANIKQDDDSAQLRALGYESNFDRSMSKWENFSLGFTYLSPVVGVYSVFALGMTAGGPPMFWSYLLIGFCQLMVCLIFGEVVSQFPISGGLYPWARRLVGKRWAWMAGWIYACALCASIAAVASGGAPFLAQLLGFEAGAATNGIVAMCMILTTTLLNLSGTRLLVRVAMFGFICELIGAIIVGGYLLIFARHQDWSVVFNTFGMVSEGSYVWAFAASAVASMFCYYGFEACGDVAEETPDPSRMIPKAMRMTIYVGGASAMFVCLALILAIPDMGSVISGKDKEPVATVLRTAMGETGFRAVIVVVLVSFVSCLLSLQAATSRLLFAYGRDRMIIGSSYLAKLSPRTHVPLVSLLISGIVPGALVLGGIWLQDAVNTIINSAAILIYIAFQLLVLAALIARAKGWQPAGSFTLGKWGWPVNIFSLGFGIIAIIDMAWPRAPADPWYSNYAMIITAVGVFVIGLAYMLIARPYDRGGAPAGDAHLLHLQAARYQ